jgi:hypothetical protein
VSKRSKEKKPAPLTDWEVAHKGGSATVVSARYSRDRDGGCTFSDDSGIAWDFPPGAVFFVRSLHTRVPDLHAREDEIRQSGYEAADPGPIPVGKR